MAIGSKIVQLIRRIIEEKLANIYTQMPGQVVSYDDSKNTCSVQPCINRIRTNSASSDFIKLPQLDDVPVKQFGSGKVHLTVAPQAGSYGAICFSMRSIAEWFINGGIVDPTNSRKFDLSNCWFDPGLYPDASDGDNGKIDSGINTDRIELRTRTGDTSIAVLDDETIEIKNSSATITIPSSGIVDINGNFTVDP
jgi:hypothetical protein